MQRNEYKTLLESNTNTIAEDRAAQAEAAREAGKGSDYDWRTGIKVGSLRRDEALEVAEALDGFDFAIVCHCWQLEELDEGLAKAAKRAKRLGLKGIEAKIVERFGRFVGKYDALDFLDGVTFQTFATVAVRGPEMKLPGGWELVAVIDHASGEGNGNLIKRVPGFENLRFPKAWRTDPNTCDHCKTNRKRNETFVLRNKRGKKVRVGRQCVADFLGHGSPKSVVGGLTLIRDFAGFGSWDENERGCFGGRGPTVLSIESFLSFCACLILASGWTSRKKAYEQGGEATATLAWNTLLAALDDPKARATVKSLYEKHGEQASEISEKALDFARTIKGESEYCHNLRVASALDVVTFKTTGIVASAIPVYQRHVEKTVARRNLPEIKADAWLGEAGDKFGRNLSKKDREKGATAYPAITGVVLAIRHLDFSSLVKVLTLDGQIVTWFASSCPRVDQGAKVEVIGTVKRQSSFRGQKETQLTRCIMTAL